MLSLNIEEGLVSDFIPWVHTNVTPIVFLRRRLNKIVSEVDFLSQTIDAPP